MSAHDNLIRTADETGGKMKQAIAKCGHEVNVSHPGTEVEQVPDCCSMCEELIEDDEDYESPIPLPH